MGKYGSLYEGLDVTRNTAILYYSAFTLRRLLFAWTAVYLVDYGIFQIQVFCVCSIFYSVYLVGVRPFKSDFVNNIEIVNEIGINSFSFLLFLLTPLEQRSGVRYSIGWTLVLLTLSVMAINILAIILRSFISCIQKC